MIGKKKVWLALAGIAMLLLIAGGVSWAWWFKTDPQVVVVASCKRKPLAKNHGRWNRGTSRDFRTDA